MVLVLSKTHVPEKSAALFCAVPVLCRMGLGMPVMSWTVRTQTQRETALRHADQIVFEGMRP